MAWHEMRFRAHRMCEDDGTLYRPVIEGRLSVTTALFESLSEISHPCSSARGGRVMHIMATSRLQPCNKENWSGRKYPTERHLGHSSG